MRTTLAFLGCLAVAVACSSGGGGPADASGGGGTTGTAGSTGAAGMTNVKCNGRPDQCCDRENPGCAATLEAQLAKPAQCAFGGNERRDTTCGDYRFISMPSCLPLTTCVYDASGDLVAWKYCEDTVTICSDSCQRGGRHADGGVTTYFTPAGPPCLSSP
jgi:hypothetical protein